MPWTKLKLVDLTTLHPTTAAFLKQENIKIVPFDLELTYEYWQADDILGAVLPAELVDDSPAGFTMTGHIAHLNLREAYLPYKHMIGQVILDKNTSIRTVVNKLDTIDSVYRNFQMEVLAGEANFIAEQHESGCRFRFDFSKVYWNSRLHTEHERLVTLFKEGDAVCDVMAGVGPFAVPAAKKRVLVFANDLNPASFEALKDNIELNKVSDFVVAYNIDGREFIRNSIRELVKKAEAESSITIDAKSPARKRTKTGDPNSKPDRPHRIPIPRTFQHYVMNLPGSAIEFLDAFRGLYHGLELGNSLPEIHVHCFTKFEDEKAKEDLATRISGALDHEVSQEKIKYHHVRRVAPNKDMFCCSFILPLEVAYGTPRL